MPKVETVKPIIKGGKVVYVAKEPTGTFVSTDPTKSYYGQEVRVSQKTGRIIPATVTVTAEDKASDILRKAREAELSLKELKQLATRQTELRKYAEEQRKRQAKIIRQQILEEGRKGVPSKFEQLVLPQSQMPFTSAAKSYRDVVFEPKPLTIQQARQEMGLVGVVEPTPKKTWIKKLEQFKEEQEIKAIRGKSGIVENILVGTALQAALGGIKGGLGYVKIATKPISTLKNLANQLKDPLGTIKLYAEEFQKAPVEVIVEFLTFEKLMNLSGKLAKRSPVARFVLEEVYIRRQPKEIRPYVRAIIKSAKLQEKINPFKVKGINKVDFYEVKSITRTEAKSLKKTLQNTDSVVFGSSAARTLSKKGTPIPKDVDIATKSATVFNQKFIRNLPKKIRQNYILQGQKMYRISTKAAPNSIKKGSKYYTPIFDIKPLSRLIPEKGILTGTGRIPVIGSVKKFKVIEQIKKLEAISDKILGNKLKLDKIKNIKARNKLVKEISNLQKRLTKESKKIRLSNLPKKTRTVIDQALDVPTQKLVTVEGIKMVGFGEQTLRKALGTLQVLIEKNMKRAKKRAKDPQSFLIGLEIQLKALKAKVMPKSALAKRVRLNKIKTLQNAIKLLKSKEFANLLDSKVAGLTKEYPLISKLNPNKLKNVNLAEVKRKVAAARIKGKVKTAIKRKPQLERVSPNKIPKKQLIEKVRNIPKSKLPSYLSKLKRSRLPSVLSRLSSSSLIRILRKHAPSTLLRPSRMPKSRLPSRIKVPSRLPISKIPPSKLPPTRKIISKIPPSKIKASSFIPSRFPSSKLYQSFIPISKIPPLRIPKTKTPPPQIKFESEKEKIDKVVKRLEKVDRKFVYLPDLASKIYGLKSTAKERRALLRKGRIFSGLETRKLTR